MSNASTFLHRRHDSTLIRREATLDGFVDDLADAPGISLCEVESLTTIVVRTHNSQYRLVITSGTSAIVQGGAFFPEPTPARIDGSGFGGTLLKVGWIGVGLRMELFTNGRRIITSPVRDVTVERAPSGSVH